MPHKGANIEKETEKQRGNENAKYIFTVALDFSAHGRSMLTKTFLKNACILISIDTVIILEIESGYFFGVKIILNRKG